MPQVFRRILIPVKQLHTARGVVCRCVDAAVAVPALVGRLTVCLRVYLHRLSM